MYYYFFSVSVVYETPVVLARNTYYKQYKVIWVICVYNYVMEIPLEEPKKKRGRKKKVDIQTNEAIEVESVPKKRGRKPKGGKLVTKEDLNHMDNAGIANIILHLKCSMNDLSTHNTGFAYQVSDPLTYNPTAPPTVSNYDIDSINFSLYNQSTNISPSPYIDPAQSGDLNNNTNNNTNICGLCKNDMGYDNTNNNATDNDDDISMKDINDKLKEIKLQLYRSEYPDKKVACFWCTYEYDNPMCFIPKYDMDTVIHGYGSFCRPECGAAYLMKENIDDSVKFERYHLLNQIYGKVYNYKNNIKPAPNPHYLLEKFYGNLSIQEYRKLLKSEHMLLVIDKPMTRILPELHEENESFMSNYNNKPNTANNSSGVYKVKKQSEKKKGPSKTDIIKETFGR
jgi:hypothetical protein